MHCLFILPLPALTGVQGRKMDAVQTMIDAHEALGIKLSIVALEPEATGTNPVYQKFSKFEMMCNNLFKIVRFGIFKHVGNRLWRNNLLNAVGRFHADNAIDASFAFSMLRTPSVFSCKLKELFGISYVINEHRSVYQRFYKSREDVSKIDLMSLDGAKHIFALTEPHRQHILRVSRQPVSVVPLALPDGFFVPLGDLPDKKGKMIASWSNWRSLKRLDLLIEAFILVSRSQSDVRLVVAGPVPDPENLAGVKRRLMEESVLDRVEFLGPVSRSEIKKLAYGCDLCVISSDHETFGIPASEALAAGKPIVTTRCGGPESFVKEGINGISVDCDDHAAMAEAMQYILENAERFEGQHIVRDAKEMFSIRALSDILKNTYESFGWQMKTSILSGNDKNLG